MRIVGVNIDDSKRVGIGLTAIYGIGRSSSHKACSFCDINPLKKIKDLTESDVRKLKMEIEKFLIEGDLRRYTTSNIKRLVNINCYRGIRHKKGLPSRGQRTRTNARTKRRMPMPLGPKA
ncbi:30S ribosomal subunit protein S13 [Candidatus Tremblaya phenacola PAVE]|nr:30S ribosomal subunit protein S13 [Candidatus Tremblaya phenacola PAVE]